MGKKEKIAYIISVFVLSIIVCILCFMVYRHEGRIKDLNRVILLLDERKADNPSYQAQYPDDTFNFLAIGNSITVHVKCDYWWQQIGMAASTADKDYFHIVYNAIEERKGPVTSAVCNLAIWEQLGTDRAEALEKMYPYLGSNLDLVIVQLGENVSNMDTFESDFGYLILQVKDRCPDAQIIIVGDYWWHIGRDKIKKKIAEEYGCTYVSIEAIQNKSEYKRSLGDTVYDEDGDEHIVEHSGVAKHPNDDGMEYIATQIIQVIDWDK